ncbi:MAG: acyl-CoA dehydrogenase family protein [Myxococcota bacterium]|nr:acyl-CoA dehydrogenase family protein [Myxococcota bacterium]
MDFRDSPSEAAFRAEACAFLDAHAPEKLGDYWSDDASPEEVLAQHRSWQRTLYDHGWGAITWPQEHGGRGLGPIEQIIWNEELSRRGISGSLFMVGIGMAGPTLIAHGTEEQKARHLDPLLSAEEIWCQLFSEPGAGSDLAAVGTRAERDGEAEDADWIVNGQKIWSSGAHYADFGILIARTDVSVPKHQGITYFLLDMKTPGIEVRPTVEMTGDSHFNEVFFSDVRIPDSARLGAVGGGWGVTQTTLMNERMAMGGVEGMLSFDELRDFVREHAGEIDGVLRDELVRLYGWLKALQLLNARVVTKLGKGVIPTAESSVMKLQIARIMTKAADLALRAAGPEGLARKGYWQNQFLFSPAWHIAGGTDQIQKNVAAERVLGLPREPDPSRELPFEELRRSS